MDGDECMQVAQKNSRPQPPTDHLVTAVELAEHPEWGNCELIRGKVIFLEHPKPLHGIVTCAVGARIGEFVKARKLGKVFSGKAGIWSERNPDSIFGPDISYISAARAPSKERLNDYMEVAPELCVEVVSPTDRWAEITEKVDMYLAMGVVLVWVVDPEFRNAHVYRRGREPLVVSGAGALDGEEALSGFSLPLSDVFAVLD